MLDAAGAWPVLVVASEPVEAYIAATKRDARVVRNDEPERGMTHSLALADAALDRDEAMAVLLADLPSCDAAAVARVVAAYDPDADDVVVPRAAERFGHPVIFGPAARARIGMLPDGDALHRLRDDAALRRHVVDVADASAFHDIDTEADLRAFTDRA